MALSWDETVDLLKVITAKDRRTIGQGDIHFWYRAAIDGGWPSLPFAAAAIVKHTNDSPGVWLEPGHITKYLRKVRSDVFEKWSPPVPPAHMIDDNVASQRYANQSFNEALNAALDEFTGSLTTKQVQKSIRADIQLAEISRLKRTRDEEGRAEQGGMESLMETIREQEQLGEE